MLYTTLFALLLAQCVAMPHPSQTAPKAYYGNPRNGCRADEVRYIGHGFDAGLDFCTSPCDQWGQSCPRNVPSSTTALPDCALALNGKGACALVCHGLQNYTCPPGATCSERGLCTYDTDTAIDDVQPSAIPTAAVTPLHDAVPAASSMLFSFVIHEKDWVCYQYEGSAWYDGKHIKASISNVATFHDSTIRQGQRCDSIFVEYPQHMNFQYGGEVSTVQGADGTTSTRQKFSLWPVSSI